MPRHTSKPRKGVSLAKGPVALLGLLGVIYGISALIFASHSFPTHAVPHGAVHGSTWLALQVNGWSALLFIAAGLLLVFGAPAHWGAKGMALLVGLVLIAAAVIAIVRGDGVFGLFAANKITELVWILAGLVLIALARLPRVGARPGPKPDDSQSEASTGAQRPNHPDEQDRPPVAGAVRTKNETSR